MGKPAWKRDFMNKPGCNIILRLLFMIFILYFGHGRTEADPYTSSFSPGLKCQDRGGIYSLCSGATPTLYATSPCNTVGTCTYQWYYYEEVVFPHGWKTVSGGTSNSYTVTSSKRVKCHVINSLLGTDYYTDECNVQIASTTPSVSPIPAPSSLCLGNGITFSVTATGSYLAYQWYQAGAAISGATSSSYTFTPAAGNDQMQYYCTVSNGCGSPSSNTITLDIIQPPVSGTLPSPSICQGTPTSFTANLAGGDANRYVWEYSLNSTSGYSPVPESAPFSGTQSSTLTLTNTGGEYDKYYFRYIAKNSCDVSSSPSPPGYLVVTIPPSITSPVANKSVCLGSPVTFSLTAAGNYLQYKWYIQNGEITGATGSSYTFTPVSGNDLNVLKCIVSNTCGTPSPSTGTLDVIHPPSVSNPVASTICEGQGASFTSTLTGGDVNQYEWQYGYQNANFSTVPANATFTNPGTLQLTLTNTPAVYSDYYFRLVGRQTSCGTSATSASVKLTVNSPPSSPITPLSQVKCTGQSVTFSGSASGTAPLEYLWRKGGVSQTGWTTSTYSISSVQPANAGQYDYLVRNMCNTTGLESDDATLTVNSPPSILSNPASIALCEGSLPNVKFTASASGGTSLQWQVKTHVADWTSLANNGTYSGVTGTELTVTNPTAGLNQNLYRCQVLGSCDPPVTTAEALLTVKSAPSVLQAPLADTICEGGDHLFSVSAAGTGPLYYKWREGGTSVTDWTTDNTYSLVGAKLTDNKNFDVLIKNECNGAGIESDDAALTVMPAPSVSLGSTRHVCNGETILLDPGSGYAGYSWSTGATTRTVEAGQQGIYSVTVADAHGCENSADVYIILDPNLAPFSLGADRGYCQGSSVLLDATSAYDSYTWNNGTSSSTLPVIKSGTYWVRVKNGNSVCTLTDSVDIFIKEPFADEKICLVTISRTGKYLVVWEKTPEVGIKTYNIYRESNVQGKYDLIGTKAEPNLSVFLDTEADPSSREYKYKITSVDTCKNESDITKSPYHKPIFLQYVSSEGGVNLRWNEYKIENATVSFDSYIIFRGSSSDALSELTTLPGGSTVYTDKDPLALQKKYYYQIAGVLSNPCQPTGSLKSGLVEEDYSRSFSNIEDNHPTGIFDQRANACAIYPNPFSESALVVFDNPAASSYTLVLTDLSGKMVKMVTGIRTSEFLLERGSLLNGYYLIEIRGPEIYRNRIIVE
jgi:hypothetical protein